jgi:hypothetical protein
MFFFFFKGKNKPSKREKERVSVDWLKLTKVVTGVSGKSGMAWMLISYKAKGILVIFTKQWVGHGHPQSSRVSATEPNHIGMRGVMRLCRYATA